MRKLAEGAGVDTSEPAAVPRFDKKRPGRKTSNDEWQNPHDPDAKVGRTKRGATRMIYKPEHLVDLETGAIVDTDVKPGDAYDTEELADRVFETEARLNEALGDSKATARVEFVAADAGYFKLTGIELLQGVSIQTVIPDSQKHRRLDWLTDEERAVVDAARQTVTSEAGQVLGRRRSELVERGFKRVLDRAAARRTTLRGRENIRMRYLIRAMGANLSLLMQHLTGVGTPKQALAGPERLLVVFEALLAVSRDFRRCILPGKATAPFIFGGLPLMGSQRSTRAKRIHESITGRVVQQTANAI